MTIPTSRKPTSWLAYPQNFWRLVALSPLLLYRMGLGRVLALLRVLVLTTRGRKSGLPRSVPLEFRQHGRKIYLVSVWGAETQWFRNLQANPQAVVQMGGQPYAVRAQQITEPAEALRVLYLFRHAAPGRYDAVLSRWADAEINGHTLKNVVGQFTVVRLDLVDEPVLLPPLEVDLLWAWPFVGLAGLVILALLRRIRSS